MRTGPVTGDADVVIVGAGAAGLSLAHRLPDTASVVLVDAPAGPLRPAERTWCFWEEGPGAYDEAVAASWERLRVRGTDGRPVEGRPEPLRYKMLRSGAFEALVAGWLGGRPGFRRVEAAVDVVRDVPGGGGAEVRGVAGDGRRVVLRARWAFDSRPPRRLPPARTTLFQHFRGWFVSAERAAFEPGVAELMDFRTRQPGRGLSFGYLLPFSPREALVEYTEFAPALLDHDGYERALRHYTRDVLGLDGLRVTAVEQGVIPMTDAVFPRRTGKSVFRIGTAGGATRPATGYTFAAVQRQSRAVAAAYRRGRPPVPPPAHPAKSRAMDAVLLRALATGRIDGAAFFTGLFRGVPTERLLRFLDGRSSLWEDLTIGLRTPVRPMLRTAAELPVVVRRRAR
ncbi:lycopene cyclase family protein [Streptomyces sp. URMC 129]|uniref:lycopene cyclase family protein n=1 Tax=Streptomyces sp. URMC 129 TaxID=3423407 RepID=UPI003F1A9958